MTGKLSASDLLEIAEDIPCGWEGDSDYDRFFTTRSYQRIKDRWPDCQITRRWNSQSACVGELIASEVAAIVANGEPYTYDPWYGKCDIPLEVGESLTFVLSGSGSGVAAEISSVAGCTVSGITVTDPGENYARPYVNPPTFSLSGGSGTGASFSASGGFAGYSGFLATFGVSSGNATGGTGYVDGESLTVTASAAYTPVTVKAATVTIKAAGGVATGITITEPGQYYWIDPTDPAEKDIIHAYDSRGYTTYANRKYEVVIDDDLDSPTLGQITAVNYTADEDFATGSFAATPTSSLTAAEREFMMQGFCPQDTPTPSGFSGFWEPLTSYDPVTFADADEVADQIAILYGTGGGLDAAKLYRGYCSDRTLVNSKTSGSGFYAPAGWSTPYRSGQTLTAAKLREQCGMPRLTASAPTGSGAILSVTMTNTPGSSNWYVSAVGVTNGGTGYVDEDSVTFAVESGAQATAATAKIQTTDGVIQSVDVLTGGTYIAPSLGRLPWKPKPHEDHPSVFRAYAVAFFATNDVPSVRSITLSGSTGDTVVDRLIETGTQDIQVVRDELDDPLDGYAKTAALELRDGCSSLLDDGYGDDPLDKYPGDLFYDTPAYPGRKWLLITITKSDGPTLLYTWEVLVKFYACYSPEQLPATGSGGPQVYSWSIWEQDEVANTGDYLELIDASTDIKPYIDQSDCEALNLRSDAQCSGGQWESFEIVGSGESPMQAECCPGDNPTDNDYYDDETP
jgi:hypothetical protein